jgi:anti-sigma regulatory factor (Ser/Thr protein kinase)
VVRVRDRGSWRDPGPDDAARGRGRGLFLVRELTDAMDIEKDGGTTVTMRRRVKRA